MLGRKKLDLDDVTKLKQMIDFGHPTKVIADNFNVSPQMVRLIRKGKRWPDEYQKILIQKEQLDKLPFIEEYVMIDKINGINLLSKISPVITLNGTVYIILHYVNHKLTSEKLSGLFEEIPTYLQLKKIHNKFIQTIL